jgi:hypothetical protein
LSQAAVRRLGLSAGRKGLHVWLRLAELPDHKAHSFWREMLARLGAAQKAAGWGLELETAVADDERAIFDTLDDLIDELLTETDCQRIFFLIDDFDLLLPGISGREGSTSRDLDWLRAIATRYSQSLAFAMSSSEPLAAIEAKLLQRDGIETQVSSFANTFHNRALGLLTQAEAEQLCQETAVAERQSPFTSADFEFLLREAGRHPALLKIACGYLFEAHQYDQSDAVYLDVSSDVRLDDHVMWLCRQLWQRRTSDEQESLIRLTRTQGEAVDPILLTRLKRHLGLIEERDGQLTLFSDAYAYWVQRELHKPFEDAPKAKTAVPSDELVYLPDKRLVYLDEREVHLTSLEGRLLAYLLAHKNQVCMADELLNYVWGPGKTRSVVEKAINRLRIKIELDPKRPRFLLSARGEGYLLRLE